MRKKHADSLDLIEYQRWVLDIWSTKKKKLTLSDDYVMGMGLGGETGEVLEILKKNVRDNKLDLNHLSEEIGDVLYYLVMICNRHGLSLGDVIEQSVEKVNKRYGKKPTKSKAKIIH